MDPIWIWGTIGLVLLVIEMASNTFYVLWFGVAAFFLAFVLWLDPSLPISLQYAVFSVLSLGALSIWRRYYQKNARHSRVGQSQGDEIGRLGTVTQKVSPKQNGKIRFAQGLMGSRDWTAIADETIETDSEARVIAVVGNTLKISKK